MIDKDEVMDFQELEAFVLAVETGSITRAAHRLGRVQSSVSLRIKQLEDELGVELLRRERSGVRTTARGEIFYSYAARILALAQQAKLEAVSPVTTEVIRLGSIETISPDRVDRIVRLLAGLDGVSVDVKTGCTGELIADLADGRIDAAIVGAGFASPDAIRVQLFRETMVVISSLDHDPIDAANKASWDNFLVGNKGSASRRNLEILFSEGGFQPARVSECGSLNILLSSVARGVGIALVPLSVVRGSPYEDRMLIHPVRGGFSTFWVEFVSARPEPRSGLSVLVENIGAAFPEMQTAN